MRINIYKCEQCGTTTEDFYNKKGWIRIIGVEEILLFEEKDSLNEIEAKSWINEKFDENEDDNALDFCSKHCISEFFASLDDICKAES